jgi:hypothetical protein
MRQSAQPWWVCSVVPEWPDSVCDLTTVAGDVDADGDTDVIAVNANNTRVMLAG